MGIAWGRNEATATVREALSARLARWREGEAARAPLWLVAALGAGVGLYFIAPVEPRPWTGAAALALIGVALACLRPVGPFRVGLPLLLAAALGFTAAQLRTHIVTAPVLSHSLSLTEVEGRLVRLAGGEAGVRLIVRPERIDGVAAAARPQLIRVSVAGDPRALWPGARIRFKASLRPPSGPVMPGGYDFARAAFFQGIGATGAVRGEIAILPPGPPGPPGAADPLAEAAAGIWRWRLAIARDIRARLPGAEGAIAAALITGDRSFIPEADLEALRDSSLAHLLSISGVHMSLVGAGLFWLMRGAFALVPALVLRFPVKKWAAVAALAGTSVYLVLSGASIPTVRAYIMIALMFLAILADRPALSLRVVLLSAALILIAAPESLLDPSFQMSYAAVIALVSAYEAVNEWRGPREAPGLLARAALVVGASVLTSLVAGLATAPFASHHFGQFASYGVVANGLASPLVGLVVMPAAVLVMLLMPFGAHDLALALMGAGLTGVLEIAHLVASWPGAAVRVPAIGDLGLAVLTVGGLWLAIWRTPLRLLGVAGIGLGLLIAGLQRPPDLIVADRGGTIAVRDASGALQLFGAAARFASEIWLRRDGDARPLAAARPGGACGRDLCSVLVTRDGRPWRIALVRRPAGAAEACARADIVVAPFALWPCPRPLRVLDRPALAATGAVAIVFDARSFRETAVTPRRGRRPWTAAPDGAQ